MQQVIHPRRDPAPSRLAYRMHRLWLTPLFRAFLRRGVPALVIAASVGLYLGNTARRDALVAQFDSLKTRVEQRPEFMVSMMSIDGASPALGDAIRNMLHISFPISSFDLKLPVIRSRIESFDAVASADLRVAPGGVLQVTVHERVPVMVWRNRGGLELIDASGHRVAGLTERAARADLPLIAGTGAEEAVPEARAIFAAAGPLGPRVRGLVRIGERRWNVVLDRDQTIMLPEKEPVAALERVIALDQAQGLLEHAVTVVDMRLPDRPTLRLTAEAYAARQAGLGLKPTGAASR